MDAGLSDTPESVAPPFAAVDWQRAWLHPFAANAGPLVAAGSWRLAANALAGKRGLVNHRGAPIHFCLQEELPAATAYESFISHTGRIPTRNNLHDFFNALVWLAYPQAKARLNALQAAEIERCAAAAITAPDTGDAKATATASPSASVALTSSGARARAGAGADTGIKGGPVTRGRLRDRATLFDENAGILVTCEADVQPALQAHDWQQALVLHRAAFGTTCEVRLFGHALLEKLVRPYKAITAHLWVLQVEPAWLQQPESEKRIALDQLLAQHLSAGLLGTSPLHLPLLGVPGWHDVQDAAFYADADVFRSRRRQPA